MALNEISALFHAQGMLVSFNFQKLGNINASLISVNTGVDSSWSNHLRKNNNNSNGNNESGNDL